MKILAVIERIRGSQEEKMRRTIEESKLDLITGGYDKDFDQFVTQLECLKDKSII